MQNPSWLGKLVGGGLGLLIAGPFGALLGTFAGHLVDRFRALRSRIGGQLQRVRETFFVTTFTLMGRIAKSDGRVSEREIEVTEQRMARMGLGADHRREAIAHFKRGAAPGFDIDAQIAAFTRDCAAHPALRQMLLMFLFSTAAADGALAGAEHDLLRRIAMRIGFSEPAFEQVMRMFQAQDHFQGEPGSAAPSHSLADAYEALGVSEAAGDREVKQAYRRLMSQYHPDKLIAEGMPEDMVKMATERTQEIQAAWEQVRRARGI